MKTNFLVRMYAMAMSAVFAVMATAGVAVMMTQNGEVTLSQMSAAAASAQKPVQPAAAPQLVSHRNDAAGVFTQNL